MVSPEQQWHQQHNQAHPVGRKPKISRLSLICIGIVVLVIGGFGTYFSLTSTTPGEGDCATTRDSGGKVKFEKADCAAPNAVYLLADEVTARKPSCPDGDYLIGFDSGSRKSKTDTVTCYALNVKEGDCLKAHRYRGMTVSDRVPCAGAEQKVVKVVAGKADDTLCETGTESTVYSKPAKTICMVKP